MLSKMPKKNGNSSGAKAKREEMSPKDSYEEDEGGGGGSRASRAQRKRKEKAESRAALVAKKAEARRLAEQEETELVKVRKQKLTEADRLRNKEEELVTRKREEEKRKKETRRWVDEREYAGMVCTANTNRAVSDLDARNVDEAIAQLVGVGGLRSVHVTAGLFKAFEEKEMEKVKKEKPGLTLAQYKDAVKKLWNKSPDNPLNHQQQQVAVMVNAKKKNQTTARNQMRQQKTIALCE